MAELATRSGARRGSTERTIACHGHPGILPHSALPTKKVGKVDKHPARSGTEITMDPAIVLFGLGIGVLVGMTGMGGGSLMTPLLILIFGIQPTTAIGTDIVYSAITKMVGGWRHFRLGTVNMELVKWLSFGSVPAAVAGVALVSVLAGPRRRRPARLARLRGARRHPADGRDHHPGPGPDPAQPDRRARPLRGREAPQGRRDRDRRHHRLRDRRSPRPARAP